jgi:hypothetical protein
MVDEEGEAETDLFELQQAMAGMAQVSLDASTLGSGSSALGSIALQGVGDLKRNTKASQKE